MRKASALAVLLLASGAAGQDPAPPKEPFFRTLLESREYRLKDEFDELGTAFEFGGVTTDRCSTADALKRARAWLDGAVPADALAALRGAGKKAGELAGLAGAAAAKGDLALAVATLLEAVDLEPENPAILANLAAALSAVGLCAEAIALAEAAEPLAGKKTGALGLPLRCIALNARGHALIRQGKPADAVKPLKEAVELGGALAADAARNLALALKKSEQEEEAKKFFLLGCWRRTVAKPVCTGGKTRKPGEPPPEPFEAGVSTRAPISRLFDLSHGVEGKFPIFKYPQNLAQMKPFENFLKREEAAKSAFLKLKSPRNTKIVTLADRGAYNVYHRIQTIRTDPDIKPLYDEMKAARKELSEKYGELNKQHGKRWNELLDSHLKGEAYRAAELALANEYIAAAHAPCEAYEKVVRKYWKTARKYMSGLAANIKAEDWHALAEHAITEDMHFHWVSDLLHPIWSSHRFVGPTLKDGELEVPDGPEDEKSPKCPGVGFEVGAGPLSFSMSCESVGLELSSEGFLKGFVSVEAKWSGEMTVYAGAKFEAGIKGVGGGNVHDGFYVTGDKNGLKDAGFRVGMEAYTEVAGVKMKTTVDQMDFSLMPRAP